MGRLIIMTPFENYIVHWILQYKFYLRTDDAIQAIKFSKHI